jgi:hypothetical protein
MPVILATQETENRRIAVQSQPWVNSSRDPISKILNTKRVDRMAQVVGCLLSKCEALSSSLNTTKTNKKTLEHKHNSAK